MNWKEYRAQLLKDPEVKAEYDRLAPEYELARSIIQQRLKKNMTQQELAERVGTKQPGIARIENPVYGRATISMLKK